jgi:uncharacterized protein YegP (UPF0339 family)
VSARQARFELVRSDAGWFARFIASNGKEVWRTSETYTTRRRATDALRLIGRPFDAYLTSVGMRPLTDALAATEVRVVDER